MWNTLGLILPDLQLATNAVSCSSGDCANATVKNGNVKRCRKAKRSYVTNLKVKSNGVPRQAEVAEGVPGRLRPRIFLTFRHYKGGRSSAKRTGHRYPRRNPWYSQRLSRPQGTWFCWGYHGKNPQ